jgi:pimeloyl-ACP methyl ester carboxylesterase
MIRILLATVLCLPLAAMANATDVGKEQRWAEQVEANLFDGEMVWLDAEGHEFLGILTEADDPRGYVVLAHGTGVHPDWAQVINPLRVELVEHGWTTLSIQMPVLANEASHEDYQPVFAEAPARLEAAAASFADDKPVFLVAHSLGAAMSTSYLSNTDTSPFAGFVGIGMSGNSAFSESDNVISLASVSLPVLDLYGESDFESVLDTADARAAAQSGNAAYTQQAIPGANHFFDGQDAELVEAVAAWLKDRSQ